MMEYIKRKDRIEKGGEELLKIVKAIGGKTEFYHRFSKWCDCYYGKMLDHLDAWYITMPDGKVGAFLIDPLGRLACPLSEKADVLYWLINNGWSIDDPADGDDDECEEEV